MNRKSCIIKHPAGPREAVRYLTAFFDVFDRPLTFDDFKRYLSDSGFDISGLPDLLSKESGIETDGHYYYLHGRSANVGKYERNVHFERQYKDKAAKYVSLLRHVPFVRGVALCNNLSFGSVDRDSDIDLFIITGEGRIFTARILSTLLFHLLGVRRHGKKISGRFCLSFYVAGETFSLEDIAIDDDYYLHFWGRYLLPVVGNEELHKFRSFNKSFLNLKKDGDYDGEKNEKSFVRDFFERLLSGRAGAYLEDKFEKWHLKRLAGRTNLINDDFGVIVNEKMLKFHNLDRRKEYAELFNERMRKF